jgi:hypothetical protein
MRLVNGEGMRLFWTGRWPEIVEAPGKCGTASYEPAGVPPQPKSKRAEGGEAESRAEIDKSMSETTTPR